MKPVIVILLLICILAVRVHEAKAWDYKGHKIVALIASAHLTPAARRGVKTLLRSEGKTSLDQVSSWADRIRDLPSLKYPNHSVRLPLDDTPYDASRDCSKKRCVIAAILEDYDVLVDGNASTDAKTAALKYLVHFVGDIHQPLHTSVDTGDSRLFFFDDRTITLHKMWDTEILRCQGLPPELLAGKIDVEQTFTEDESRPIEWALEGRAIARQEIFPELASQDSGPQRLSRAYCAKHWPTVKLRLKQAGMRLARLLNEIFS